MRRTRRVEYTQRWLTELQKLLLRLRVRAGGVQIEDGLSLRELQLGPTLGQGAFGVVRLARSRLLPDRFYAVKICTDQPGVEDEMKAVERGARSSHSSHAVPRLHHRQLYTYLVASGESQHPVPRDARCARRRALRPSARSRRIAESAAQFYAACLVLALQHLPLPRRRIPRPQGRERAAHRRPLLPHCRLASTPADVGLANFAKADLLHSFCGTPSFIAPEVATNAATPPPSTGGGSASSFARCSRCARADGVTGKATVANVIANRRTLLRPLASLVSPNAASFIDALLQPDPTERLGGPLRAHSFACIPSSGASTGRVSRSAKCPRPTPPRAPRAAKMVSRWPLIRSRPRATWRNRAPTALRPRLRRCPRWHCLRQAEPAEPTPMNLL